MRSLLITIAGITLSLGAIQDSASAQDCSPITSQQKYRELTREEATNCGAELFRGLSQRREGDLSERFYLRAHCHALDATALRRIAEHYINGEPAGRAGKILRKAPLQDRIFRVTVEILPSSPLGREQSLGPFELIRYQGKFRWFDAPVLDSVCTPDNPGTSLVVNRDFAKNTHLILKFRLEAAIAPSGAVVATAQGVSATAVTIVVALVPIPFKLLIAGGAGFLASTDPAKAATN